MKKYMLFSYDIYYPNGGFGDFQESFDTLEELKNYIENMKFKRDWHDVIDRDTFESVAFNQ